MLWWLNRGNFLVCKWPMRAIEWCDFFLMPNSIRQGCQRMLNQNWHRKLPLIQSQSPAEIACVGLRSAINEVYLKTERKPLLVVDFCAGGGGPTPIFERLINARNRDDPDMRNCAPLQFMLTDLYPNVEAWREACSQSNNLSYKADKVDATDPPVELLSDGSDLKVSFVDEGLEGRHRIFRLFNLSFHHFDNHAAREILRSTLQTSDGFAIIELQDRRIGCIMMMLLNWILVFIFTLPWFLPFRGPWRRWWLNMKQLGLTYIFPVLPLTLCWDGVASCLRTREFEEVMALVGEVEGVEPHIHKESEEVTAEKACQIGEWTFTWRKQLHTFPLMYCSWITGIKTSTPKRERAGSLEASSEASGSHGNLSSSAINTDPESARAERLDSVQLSIGANTGMSTGASAGENAREKKRQDKGKGKRLSLETNMTDGSA
ncbi:hypothetical protein K504DRAFT_527986 [Pleomassaria siparia CBS 279.74]|uniref:Uncharacterized protein n=1 Tax=Pleomassaria siparia CBS 279.74 TaxID=1314801 RepID=A0A6G1K6H9_9PLEO|nr:hypothetical protein K504DRAFT_527986 [Pleomassaria siparia CBS 279.74]